MSLDIEAAEAVGRMRRLGDDLLDVEAKAAAGGLPRRGLLETCCAFANTDGGLVLLGIAQEAGFQVVDIQASKLASDLASLCADGIDPPVRPEIEVLEFEGGQIVAARIPPMDIDQRPAHIRDRGMHGGVFVRTHDGDRMLNPYEVHVLVSGRGQPRDDEELVMEASLDDLDPALVEVLLARMRSTRGAMFADLDDATILRMLGVMKVVEGSPRPTVAGLLALGRYPQEFFPQLNLSFVAYPTIDGQPSRDGVRFTDNQSIDGPIPVMLVTAAEAVTRNLRKRSLVVGLLREDQWEYPLPAIREAIANALMHRDLSAHVRGTQVRVELYPDRLAVISPGGLHGPVVEADLMNDPVTSSRNARLAKLLEDVVVPGTQATVCENRGSGLINLASSMQHAGMEPPQVRNRIRDFTLTMTNNALLDDDSVEWLNSMTLIHLSDGQRLGLAFAHRHGSVTNAQYRTLTGVSASRATRELSELADGGYLVREGEGRGASWHLVAPEGVARRESPDPRSRLSTQMRSILNVLEAGPHSTSELSRATQIGGSRAILYWLRQMEALELVAPTEANRKSPRNKWRRVRMELSE